MYWGKWSVNKDRGVSPVIAVILMVAVTVIIASVIGTSVLDMTNTLDESPPTAQFDFEYEERYTYTDEVGSITMTAVKVTHAGGDTIPTENIDLTINGHRAFAIGPKNSMDGDDIGYPSTNFTPVFRPYDAAAYDEISAGDERVVYVHETGRPDANPHVDTQFRYMSTDYNKNHFNMVGTYHSTDDRLWNRKGDAYHNEYWGDEEVRHNVKMPDIGIEKGDTLRIVWESDSGSSTVLAEYEVRQEEPDLP